MLHYGYRFGFVLAGGSGVGVLTALNTPVFAVEGVWHLDRE